MRDQEEKRKENIFQCNKILRYLILKYLNKNKRWKKKKWLKIKTRIKMKIIVHNFLNNVKQMRLQIKLKDQQS